MIKVPTRSKEASPSRETEPQAPKPFGFEQAFDDLGTSVEDVIRSHVKAGPPKVDYGQATKQVNSIMRQYKDLGESLFTAARVANARRPGAIAGRDINNLATADTALPGMDEYMQLVRSKIDSYDPSDPAAAGNHLPTDEEREFMEAMEWKALNEQRLAAPQEITALDFADSPHTGTPYETYDGAQREAIKNLIAEAAAEKKRAADQNNKDLEADQDRVIKELQYYQNAFVDFSGTFAPNRNAAGTYADKLLNGTPDAATKKAMIDQANLDRIFATYDSQVKGRMKHELDRKDIELYAKLQGDVENSQNILAEQAASDMRRFNGSGDPLTDQLAYDTASRFLGEQELRIAKRIGVPTNGGYGEKLPDNPAQVNAFLATMHTNRSTDLDAKIAINIANKRSFKDGFADFMAGRDENGNKEKSKGKNFLRRAVKVGAFAAMASLGPVGFAGAMGAMVGVGKLSKAYSKHNHELTSRESGVDINRVVALANNPALTPKQKLDAMQQLEAEQRTNDRLFLKKRLRTDIAKSAAWGIGIAISPAIAPYFTSVGASAFESGWEVTKWTAGRIF